MRKYEHEFKELAYVDTKDEASELERYLIANLDNLYNVDPGGYGIHKQFKYTDEEIREDALRYVSKKEWRDNSKIANTVRKYKPEFYNEVTSHMVRNINRKWTRESIVEDMKKYDTIAEWGENSKSAYTMLYRNGWQDLLEHLPKKEKWTVENIWESVNECSTRQEWIKLYSGARTAARRYGINNLITKHFKEKR